MTEQLSGVISMFYEKREKPFETYEDLYESQLKIVTHITWLKNPEVLDEIKDPTLWNILNTTIYVDAKEDDWSGIYSDRSYITKIPDFHHKIMFGQRIKELRTPKYFKLPFKAAQPPILSPGFSFYWFSDGSPYALKFLKAMRRIKETRLMQWPFLTVESQEIIEIDDGEYIYPVEINDMIKLEQLLTILSFGFSISIIAFIVETTIRKIKKFKVTKFHGKRYLFFKLNKIIIGMLKIDSVMNFFKHIFVDDTYKF